MPKNNKIKTILLLGAGPIVIGQACEFDYAGTQACKALKAEGYRIVLVNSNPATIMTDPEMADATYIEPLLPEVIEKIIEKEKPDAILPTLGGQTALNCTLALFDSGTLNKHDVKVIGASIQAIRLAEDRALFREIMQKIALDVPRAAQAHNKEEALALLESFSLPVVIRSSFSLGGQNANIVYSKDVYVQICDSLFNVDPQQTITVDEALVGWKEFELEVVRDKHDNCMIICGVENIDPLGIHTGDSITVSPIQTLRDKEYQQMRNAAFRILRAIGVDTGGSNVQFAVHPDTGRMVVIEMNPRVSRSSALVSKATGFPIAKIAAKLAVGYHLDELKNDISAGQLPAAFEPSLDYIVIKIPRFNLEKFSSMDLVRGPSMYSVGEVMSIGRTFLEALQKGIRSLEIGEYGFSEIYAAESTENLEKRLKQAGIYQLWAVVEAFRRGFSVEKINRITHIAAWFLFQLHSLVEAEKALIGKTLSGLSPDTLLHYKRQGFSDQRLAVLLQSSAAAVQQHREKIGITASYKRVDSCAGEFCTPTAYLYSAYEMGCEARPTANAKVVILGSGPNRIGQGIEFDYCCVQAAMALKKLGYQTVMLNCNPETVSTDYDVVDSLYCTPLTTEDVMAIIQREKPEGVLLQYGGQTPLLLAKSLVEQGVQLLGLSLDNLEQTEDRQLFSNFLESLGLKQPKNVIVFSVKEAIALLKKLRFPLILRPSFVLGGASMTIVHDETAFVNALTALCEKYAKYGVLVEEFLQDAIEVDIDAIFDGENVFIPGLMEHIEAAGVHSGDSACVVPPIRVSLLLQQQLIEQTQKIAKNLGIKGLFNIQFAIKNNDTYVLEVNPRASRSLPFMCKATGLPLVQIATSCVFGQSLIAQNIQCSVPDLPYYYVKEVVLPFSKFKNSLPVLGPEMKSTGEVMGVGTCFATAYAKAQMGAGQRLLATGNVYLAATACLLSDLSVIAKRLQELGFSLYSDLGLINYLEQSALTCKPLDLTQQSVNIDLVIALNPIGQTAPLVLAALQFAVRQHICYASTKDAANSLLLAIEVLDRVPNMITALQKS